jgi:ribosomal protein L34E
VQFPALRPKEMSNKRMSKTQKSVNRIYGGHLDHKVSVLQRRRLLLF